MSIHINKKRIFLVDDHPLVREWLANLIRQQPDLTVSGEAENGSIALSSIKSTKPDLVIADLNLKNSSGIELVKDLKEQCPCIPVLVLSMHDESLYAERVFRAGAKGYVNKRETAQKVIEAIGRVLEGKLYVNDKAAQLLAGKAVRGQTVNNTAIETLSDRELQVFEKLGLGLGTRQIADDFHVSVKTIQEYCSRIKDKLQLNNATELLREAMRWHELKNSS